MGPHGRWRVRRAPTVSELLSKTLAEEETADNLLTQIARELMGQARTGATRVTARATQPPPREGTEIEVGP